MTLTFEFSAFGFAVAVVIGALLLFALRLMRRGIEVLPAKKSRRAALLRAFPVVAALLVVIYATLAVRLVFSEHPLYSLAVLALSLLLLLGLAFPAIKDLFFGAVLRGERVFSEGDQVRIGGHAGRVKRLGARVLVIETAAGDEAFIPYGSISRDTVVRTAFVEGAVRHHFTLSVPKGRRPAEAGATVREAALLHHWSSPTRRPTVEVTEEGVLSVTVYALDARYGPDIEDAVRRALYGAGSTRGAA